MPVYSRREQVISALARGKEQRKRYSQEPPAVPVGIWGTVAVILRDGNYLVSIIELHDLPGADFDRDFDVEEMHQLPDLAAVEALLDSRFSLPLEALEPARGAKTFR